MCAVNLKTLLSFIAKSFQEGLDLFEALIANTGKRGFDENLKNESRGESISIDGMLHCVR